MYIILGWINGQPDTISVVMTDDGAPMTFDQFIRAYDYAKDNLPNSWQIINLNAMM